LIGVTASAFFAQHPLDYDPCVNNGSWQWVASTGCDAQPYFRIFNSWLQQRKFDPDGVYIKRWVPELMNVSSDLLHEIPSQELASNYPLPCVDHASEKLVTERLYSVVKKVV
jgi:deoxyribodipyrimidine photo-lyase